MGQFKKTYWLTALVTMILGIVLVIWPGLTLIYMCRFIGIAIAISGISNIVQFLKEKQSGIAGRLYLLLGALLCVIGLWLCMKPDGIVTLIPTIVGLIILFHGFVDLSHTFSLRNLGYERWYVGLVMSVLTIALAIIILLNAFAAVEFLVTLVGCALIFDGIKDILLLFTVGKATRQMKRGIKDLEAIDVDIIKEENYRN